jgi:hypothetical protein
MNRTHQTPRAAAPRARAGLPVPRNLATTRGGKTHREALSDFQKWCSHFVLFMFVFFLLLSHIFYISRYSLGCGCLFPTKVQCCGGLRNWFCDSFLIPHSHPFLPPFQVISHLPAWVREMCVLKAPQGGELGLYPGMIPGDGVDLYSTFSLREFCCV